MSLRCCLVHFLIIIISAKSVTSSIENDKMALMALRDEFTLGGTLPNVSALNSWNSSFHICNWEGIKCVRRPERVTEINLEDQKLNGVLSPWIGNLSFLRVLNLSNNALHGEIPKQIGNLQKLQYLNLRVNYFQGHIPIEVSNCSNLMVLSLQGNKLTGQIPIQLGALSKITNFDVQENYLVGEMPNFLRNFSSLTRLHIGRNNFHGEIGNSLHGLSKLRILAIPSNTFTGTICPSMCNLSSLITLDLARNNFSGALAQDFGVGLPKLGWLNLGVNSLTGTIPSTISNLSGLHLIQLHSNKFEGSIPDGLGNLGSLRFLTLGNNSFGGGEMSNDLRFIDALTNCTKLRLLQMDRNRFVGLVPDSVGNLSYHLERLSMRGNQITGSIPEVIGRLYSLSRVDFGNNLLTGTIPNSIGKLSNISVLVMNDNSFHGEIPSSIGKLTNLYELNLSANLLEGVIPRTLRNCKGMQLVDLSSNRFEGYLPDNVFSQFENIHHCNLSHNSFRGRFPSELANLETLSTLDISYNGYTGEIPAQLGESLEFISLSGNSFKGIIPSFLGNLRGLSWLDLSSNKLSGSIPRELATLVLIKNLNLSFNQLEGKVPIFKKVEGVSIEGNYNLCGGNPELHLPQCPIERTRKAILEKNIVVATISTFVFLSVCVLSFIFFYRRRSHKKENADSLHEGYRRITYAELYKATEGFSESNLIGTGSFGDVFKGNMDGDVSKPIAVKVLKLSKHGATKSFIAECRVLRSIRHRNLLGIKTSCSSLDHKGNNFKALVFNFMPNGNLDSWLHIINQDQEVRAPLSLIMRLQIALDVGYALNYLHNYCKPSIIHCDLKPSNVLLDDDMVAHVGDFGLAKLLYDSSETPSGGDSLSTTINGTIGYVAPEYGMGAKISPMGDIYSYGVLLLELITGKRPTDEMFNNKVTLRSFVERALPDHIQEVVDEYLVNELHEAMEIKTNHDRYTLQWNAILVSFAEIGISCSAESTKDRMDIQSTIKCISGIKEKCDIIC